MTSHSKRKRDPAAEVSFDALIHPNFDELARRFPNEFGRTYRAVLARQHGGHQPFSSCITQDFSLALTKALLQVHWNLTLTHMPDDKLCPPVPNRFFFVQWMLQSVLPAATCYFPTNSTRPLTFRGLDIGTGASAIYPLLLAAESNRLDMAYRIFGTDIDAESIALARHNIRSNQLDSQISVYHVAAVNRNASDHLLDEQPGPLRQSLACLPEADRVLDFCMTNPPFFDDANVLQERRQGDGRERANMSVSEGSYPGGEVAFCLDILTDALVLWRKHTHDPQHEPPPPIWSACMCGKKSSWLQLKSIVTHVLGPGHVMATEFGPGHMTRWFLAWTLLEQPVMDSPLAKHGKELCFQVTVQGDSACDEVEKRLTQYFEEFPSDHFKVVRRVATAYGLRLYACGGSFSLEEPPSDDMDEAHQLPAHLLSALAQLDPSLRRTLLPPEGNMLLTINLSTKPLQPQDVCVQVDTYAHTTRGRALLDKIRNQLAGEICRTSRRWRRRLKQQQQIVAMETV